MSVPVTGVEDLDDARALLDADTSGLLRGAASAGALVRATAAAVAEGALDALDGHAPRSVVVAGGSGSARLAGDLVAAASAASSGIPVLATHTVPRWVGPLDVLVVLADDAGDSVLAEEVGRAARRGAEVVLGCPEDGPLAAAGGSRTLRLPPRVPVPAGMSFPRHVAVAAAVLATLVGPGQPAGNLEVLADALDAEAGRDRAANDVFGNPAKRLAVRMSGHGCVLAGAGAPGTVVAEHAAVALLRHAGIVAAAVSLSDALAAPAHPGSVGHDQRAGLFHDPQLDGPLVGTPRRVLVLATAEDHARAQARTQALDDVEVLTATEVGEPGLPGAGALTELLVLGLRLETAAVYLGLLR
ncbi:MAG: tobH protein [Mycobacteriaceae bacterium]